jgi:hypothetical protein
MKGVRLPLRPRPSHRLDEGDLVSAEQTWDEYWAATRSVELTQAVEGHAGQLAHDHALRGADGDR